MYQRYLFMSLVLLQSVKAQFNATNNVTEIGWQSEPGIRGTWSILWSCLATLVLCLHTSIHMPMRHPTGTVGDVQWQILWFCVALLFPEFAVLTAWQQWRYARHLTAKVRELRQQRVKDGLDVPEYMREWSMAHSFFVDMGGVMMFRGHRKPENRAHITDDGIVQLMRERQDDALALLTKHAIEDHSKADFLAKALTVLQAGHVLLLVIVRLIARQSVSALEITTCGYVLNAFVLMFFWWCKPYNVKDFIVLDIRDSALNQNDCGHWDRIKHQKAKEPYIDQILWTTSRPTWFAPDGEIGHATIDQKYPRWAASFIFVSSTLVAGLHLALWNAYFPTPIERWIWRTSSIIIAAGGLFFGLIYIHGITAPNTTPQPEPTDDSQPTKLQLKQRQLRRRLKWFRMFIGPLYDTDFRIWFHVRNTIYIVLFLGTRLYILAESFLSLRSLPADVYIVPKWTSIIPNFG